MTTWRSDWMMIVLISMNLAQLKLSCPTNTMWKWKKVRRGPKIAKAVNIGTRVTFRRSWRAGQDNTWAIPVTRVSDMMGGRG